VPGKIEVGTGGAMNRRALIAALMDASPALAGSELLPILNCFCFNNDQVAAYNDMIGITVPCDTGGYVGAVPNVLLTFLRDCNDDEVSFTCVDKKLVVAVGAQQLNLPTLPAEQFPLVIPKPGGTATIAISKQLVHGLKVCLLTAVANDASRPEHLGITFIASKGKLQLFATDSKSLTWVRNVPVRMTGTFKRAILPVPFGQQLIAFANNKMIEQIEITSDSSIARTSDGTTLFGRLISSPQPLDFAEVLRENLPFDYRQRTIAIPTGLRLVLERANSIAALNLERARTQIVVKDGVATFRTENRDLQGHVKESINDTLQVKGHGDVKLTADPRRLLVVCGQCARMLFTNNAMIFTSERGGTVHMIGAGT
jgi:DNA polymerase III sliding clamp (beta) subunit (PCNA family)